MKDLRDLKDLTEHDVQPIGALGAGVCVLGCRVQGAGCRVQGAGCRVQGAGCRSRCTCKPMSRQAPSAGSKTQRSEFKTSPLYETPNSQSKPCTCTKENPA